MRPMFNITRWIRGLDHWLSQDMGVEIIFLNDLSVKCPVWVHWAGYGWVTVQLLIMRLCPVSIEWSNRIYILFLRPQY